MARNLGGMLILRVVERRKDLYIDLDLAADAAVNAGFGSAGERCMAVSVVVAVDPVGDELVGKIRERIARLQVGDGRDPGSEMGPLVT